MASRALSVSAEPKTAPRPNSDSSATWAPARAAYCSDTGAAADAAGRPMAIDNVPAARREAVAVLRVRGVCMVELLVSKGLLPGRSAGRPDRASPLEGVSVIASQLPPNGPETPRECPTPAQWPVISPGARRRG